MSTLELVTEKMKGKQVEMEVNSVEYWNQRFETDWSECGGNGQTIFFCEYFMQYDSRLVC